MTAQPSEEPKRQPCPRCGEAVLEIAQQCFACRADLSVSLEVVRPLADQREVYEVVKAMSAQFPTLPFATLRAVLQGRERVLARNLTRSVAVWIGAELAKYGVESEIRVNGDGSKPFASKGRALWIAAAVTAVLGGAAAAFKFSAPMREAGRALLAESPPVAGAAGAVSAGVVHLAAAPVSDARTLAARAVPATATVRCGDKQGSGFFIAPERLLTNAHVMCDGPGNTPSIILENGRNLSARVIKLDEHLDAALLEVPGANVTPLLVGDATSVKRGDKVFVIGAPLGMEFTMSQGIVAHANRRAWGLSYLQIDLSVTHGNSGGPLLDEHGSVVGLVTLKVGTDATIGLALAINHLFTGAEPLISAPSPYDSNAWQAEVRLASLEGDKERDALRAELQQPLLLRARFMGEGYRAAIAYAGGGEVPNSIILELQPSSGPSCGPFVARVVRWETVKDDASRADKTSSTFEAWMRRTRANLNVRVGLVKFNPKGCLQAQMGGAVLKLRGGLPAFDQVNVE